MKKIVLALMALCLLLPYQAEAAAQSGLYVAPKLIWGSNGYTLKASNGASKSYSEARIGGALAAGYDLSINSNLPLRGEVELGLLGKTKGKNGDIHSSVDVQTLFVNMYADLHNDTRITPYIGVGLGMARVGAQVSGFGKKTSNNFAWNLGLGAAYSVNDNIAIDLGYRYSRFGQAKTKNFNLGGTSTSAKATDLRAHQLMMGARFTF